MDLKEWLQRSGISRREKGGKRGYLEVKRFEIHYILYEDGKQNTLGKG
jgi:hypothetical protein